jgi:hypothetical protein
MPGMTPSRLAFLAAVTSAIGWGLKAVAIGIAGGLDRSPFEAPLFFLGLLAIVVAFVALGVAVAGNRPVAAKIAGGVVGIVVGVGLAMASDTIAGLVVPDSAGWVQEEAGLWVAAVVAVAVTWFWYRRRGPQGTAA